MDNVTGLRRALLLLLALALLKVLEFLVTAPSLDSLASAPSSYVTSPRVQHPRCDACRAVAGVFHVAFRAADTKIEHLGLELSLAEVNEIVENVCHRQTFRKVDLVEWDGYLRLASPNLETWAAHDGLRPGLGSLHTEAVDWPVRMEKHCKYIADKMSGIEIYDLWLRTGHSDPLDWVEFMCEGEGPFGDCAEGKSLDTWPAEVCEDKEKCESSVTLNHQPNKQAS